MYTQNHKKTILTADKKQMQELYNSLKGDNAISDRAIKQGKLAQSKKDTALKEKKEIRDALHEDVETLNAEILKDQWTLAQQRRKLNDKALTKNAQKETMEARQQSNLVGIDISIAQSRIKDLENQAQMANTQIEEILTEKRKVDKENLELEYKIAGRGVTQKDQEEKFQEAEREREMQLQHSLTAQQE